MRFIKRLMEIKEIQLQNEAYRNVLLEDILKELKGGAKDGKNTNKCNNKKR